MSSAPDHPHRSRRVLDGKSLSGSRSPNWSKLEQAARRWRMRKQLSGRRLYKGAIAAVGTSKDPLIKMLARLVDKPLPA